MLDAQKRHAIKAKITASGRDPPANATPAGIDAAMAAPGAMSVMLWKRTSRSPIALRRSPGAGPAAVVFAAIAASAVWVSLLPGWSHGRHRPWQAQDSQRGSGPRISLGSGDRSGWTHWGHAGGAARPGRSLRR